MNYLKYWVILLLCINTVFAQESITQDTQAIDFEEQNQLSQKFRMAHYLLNQSTLKTRIESAASKDASYLFNKAESNHALATDKARQKNWLESNAIIDSALRDLTTASQLLSKKSFSQNIYHENLRRLEGFTLPLWTELSQKDQQYLDNTTRQIESFVSEAKQLASQSDYDNGTTLLYQAYALKTQLLKNLEHQNTVLYDLLFDTPEEEYSYMLKRRQHYQGLVDKVLKEKTFTEQMLNLVYNYINKSEKALTDALSQEQENQHEKAIQLLDQSIADLSTALKFMGISI